jgi:putative tryptophan/tyrosine transport system substrate-binding protein
LDVKQGFPIDRAGDHMTNGLSRRELAAMIVGAALARPPAAGAEPAIQMRRVGLLLNTAEDDRETQLRITAFQGAMEQFGWMQGGNVQIDYRWSTGDVERARAAASQLLSLHPDVIVSLGSPATVVLQKSTSTVPIVFVGVSEPMYLGFVKSLARPGGSLTGFSNLEPSLGAKWFELLKNLAPHTTRVASVFNPKTTPNAEPFLRSVEMAAKGFAIESSVLPLDGPSSIEPAMTVAGREPSQGLIFLPDPFTLVYRKLIVESAARNLLPAIYSQRAFTIEGGLASYGADVVDLLRRAAFYVDRILRGEKPADLPVQQPTKFELVINLKTAKALGLRVSDELLATADEVVE